MPKLPTVVHRIAQTVRADGKSSTGRNAPATAEQISDTRPPVEPSPVLREVGKMIEFALANPEKSQVPLAHRDALSQKEWESMSPEEQQRLQTGGGEEYVGG